MSDVTEQLLTDGYAIVPGLGEAYAADLRRDVEYLHANATTKAHTKVKCPSGYFTDDGTLWNSQDPTLITHLQLTYRTSAAMLGFALDPAIVRHVSNVLGPDVETFGQGQCLLKAPNSTFSKHWHQDDAFFIHRHHGQIAALLYLQDSSEANGALQVLPGSHTQGLISHGDSQSHLGVPRSGEGSITLTGRMGDVILLHGMTLHASGPNGSAAWRYVALNRYRVAGDWVRTTGTSQSTMSEVHVPFAPKESAIGQEGLMVCGRRALTDAPGWARPIWQQNQFPV